MYFRFVDRDMVMRYHWGMGVGHVYSHGQAVVPNTSATTQIPNITTDANSVNEAALEPQIPNQDCESDGEDPELGFNNCEDDWTDSEEDLEDELNRVEEDEDEQIFAMDDMFGFAHHENHFD
jgi:hypothetical protein